MIGGILYLLQFPRWILIDWSALNNVLSSLYLETNILREISFFFLKKKEVVSLFIWISDSLHVLYCRRLMWPYTLDCLAARSVRICPFFGHHFRIMAPETDVHIRPVSCVNFSEPNGLLRAEPTRIPLAKIQIQFWQIQPGSTAETTPRIHSNTAKSLDDIYKPHTAIDTNIHANRTY